MQMQSSASKVGRYVIIPTLAGAIIGMIVARWGAGTGAPAKNTKTSVSRAVPQNPAPAPVETPTQMPKSTRGANSSPSSSDEKPLAGKAHDTAENLPPVPPHQETVDWSPYSVKTSTGTLLIDSNVFPAQALAQNRFPRSILDRMEVVPVQYLGFDHRQHLGQIVVDKELAGEVAEIFEELEQIGYPIKKVVPIVAYQWDDQASINDNNTSAFNYRKTITPSGRSNKLSNHSFGRAIDLNPYLNPYVSAAGGSPRKYDPDVEGTLTLDSPATQIFLKHGWKWGGMWKGGKDYQHFEK